MEILKQSTSTSRLYLSNVFSNASSYRPLLRGALYVIKGKLGLLTVTIFQVSVVFELIFPFSVP